MAKSNTVLSPRQKDWQKALKPVALERANKIVAKRPSRALRNMEPSVMRRPFEDWSFDRHYEDESDNGLVSLGKSLGNTLMGVATMGSAIPMVGVSKIIEGVTGKKGADWTDMFGTFSDGYKGWYGDVLNPQLGKEGGAWAALGFGMDVVLDLWWLVGPVKAVKGAVTATEVAIAGARSTSRVVRGPDEARNVGRIRSGTDDEVFEAGARVNPAETIARYRDNLDALPEPPTEVVHRTFGQVPIEVNVPKIGGGASDELETLAATVKVGESSGGQILWAQMPERWLTHHGFTNLADDVPNNGGWISVSMEQLDDVLPARYEYGQLLGSFGKDIPRATPAQQLASDPQAFVKVLESNLTGRPHVMGRKEKVYGSFGEATQAQTQRIAKTSYLNFKRLVAETRARVESGGLVMGVPSHIMSRWLDEAAGKLEVGVDEIPDMLRARRSQGPEGMFKEAGATDDTLRLDKWSEYIILRELNSLIQNPTGEAARKYLWRGEADGGGEVVYALTEEGLENVKRSLQKHIDGAVTDELKDLLAPIPWNRADEVGRIMPVLEGAGEAGLVGSGAARSIGELLAGKFGPDVASRLTGSGALNSLVDVTPQTRAYLGFKFGFGKFGFRSRAQGGIRGNLRISRKEYWRIWDETKENITKEVESGVLKGRMKKSEIDNLVDDLMNEAWQRDGYRSTMRRLGAGTTEDRAAYARGKNQTFKDWLNNMHFEVVTPIPMGQGARVLGGIPMAKSLEYQKMRQPAEGEGFGGRTIRALQRNIKYPAYRLRTQPLEMLMREWQKSIAEITQHIPERMRQDLLNRGYNSMHILGLTLYAHATDPILNNAAVEASLKQLIDIDPKYENTLAPILQDLKEGKQLPNLTQNIIPTMRKYGLYRDDFQETLKEWTKVRDNFERATGLTASNVEKLLQWRLPLLLNEASQRTIRQSPKKSGDTMQTLKGAEMTARNNIAELGSPRSVDSPSRNTMRAVYNRLFESEEQLAHVIMRHLDVEITDAVVADMRKLAKSINDMYKAVDETYIPTNLSPTKVQQIFKEEGREGAIRFLNSQPMLMRPHQVVFTEGGRLSKTSVEMDKEYRELLTEWAGENPTTMLVDMLEKSADNDFKMVLDNGDEIPVDDYFADEFQNLLIEARGDSLADDLAEAQAKIYGVEDRQVFAIAAESQLRGKRKRTFRRSEPVKSKEEMFDAQMLGKFIDEPFDRGVGEEMYFGMGLLAEMDSAILFGSQMAQSITQFHANKIIPLALMDIPYFELVQDQNRVLKNFTDARYEGADVPMTQPYVKLVDNLPLAEQEVAIQLLKSLGFEPAAAKGGAENVRIRQFSTVKEGPEAGAKVDTANLELDHLFPDNPAQAAKEVYRFTGRVDNKYSLVSESWVAQLSQLLKFSFTTPFLRHLINNAAGDYFNVMVKAGATSPNTSFKSALFWQTRSVDPETGVVRWNTRGGLDANRMTSRDFDFSQTVLVINGKEYNGYEIDTMANMVGLGRGFAGSDIVHEGKSIAGIDAFFDTYVRVQDSVKRSGSVTKPAKQYLAWASRQNIMRENAIRLHSYMAHLQQGHSPIMAMWNTVDNIFDYGALTPFEKNLVRHLILFYTWFRKNTSYQIRMAPQRLPYFAAFTGHNLNYQANVLDVDRNELGIESISRLLLPDGHALKFGEMPHVILFQMPDLVDFVGAAKRVQEGQPLSAPQEAINQWLGAEGEVGYDQVDSLRFFAKNFAGSASPIPFVEAAFNRNTFTGGEQVKYQGAQQEVGSALGIFLQITGLGTPQRQRKDGPMRPAGPPLAAAAEEVLGPVTGPVNAAFDLIGWPYDRPRDDLSTTRNILYSLSQLTGVGTYASDDAEKRKRAVKQQVTAKKAARTRLKNAREERE